MWTAVLDPFCIVYGFFVAWAMGSIVMYEYYILGNTWDVRAPVDVVVPESESPTLESEEEEIISSWSDMNWKKLLIVYFNLKF